MSAIHIHDFVDDVISNQNWSDDENYIKIHTDVNIFQEDNFYDFRIIVESIHCWIHVYLMQSDHELYNTNAFFYVNDQFTTTLIKDKLQITIQALSLQRYGFFRFSFIQTSLLMSLLQTSWRHKWFCPVSKSFTWAMVPYDHCHWLCWPWQQWKHRTISMSLFWTPHFSLWFPKDWSHQLHT